MEARERTTGHSQGLHAAESGQRGQGQNTDRSRRLPAPPGVGGQEACNRVHSRIRDGSFDSWLVTCDNKRCCGYASLQLLKAGEAAEVEREEARALFEGHVPAHTQFTMAHHGTPQHSPSTPARQADLFLVTCDW